MNLNNKTLAELEKLLKQSKTASDRNRIRAAIRKKEETQVKLKRQNLLKKGKEIIAEEKQKKQQKVAAEKDITSSLKDEKAKGKTKSKTSPAVELTEKQKGLLRGIKRDNSTMTTKQLENQIRRKPDITVKELKAAVGNASKKRTGVVKKTTPIRKPKIKPIVKTRVKPVDSPPSLRKNIGKKPAYFADQPRVSDIKATKAVVTKVKPKLDETVVASMPKSIKPAAKKISDMSLKDVGRMTAKKLGDLREKGNKVDDFLEGVFAKIGGGRTRTRAERVRDRETTERMERERMNKGGSVMYGMKKKKKEMMGGGSVKMKPAKQMNSKKYAMNRGGLASLRKPTRTI